MRLQRLETMPIQELEDRAAKGGIYAPDKAARS
jgi:hypothetical protein